MFYFYCNLPPPVTFPNIFEVFFQKVENTTKNELKCDLLVKVFSRQILT